MNSAQPGKLGGAALWVWRILRPIALAVGLLVLAGLVLVGIFFDKTADQGANTILSNARPPTASELPHVASAIPYSSEDVQILGGQGLELGCSIKKTLEWFAFPRGNKYASISLRMRQACIFHDYCYRHGAATYGYGQADCDYILLDQAYRICRFINRDDTISACVSQARKVALGVIFGGADSFKRADGTPQSPTETLSASCAVNPDLAMMDDRCTSTYFEFDPYPVRSARYAAYRIADAPESWANAGVTGKALYVFQMRPSGTRVTVVGWTPEQTICAGFNLPSRYGSLTVPPRVVRVEAPDGSGEDWFVWWRRDSLDQTGGQLAILPPRRAELGDWQGVFSGATLFDPEDCAVRVAGHPDRPPGQSPLWRSFRLGEDATAKDPLTGVSRKTFDDDANISEIHPAPGLAKKGTMLLMALRAHGCGNPSRSCYHEIEIDPRRDSGNVVLEPYKIRDGVYEVRKGDAERVESRKTSWEELREPDRYRNYATPPIPMAGPGGQPALAWLRRGESLGETYDQSALLRRAYREGTTGRGFGLVFLHEFPEAADPVFILARGSDRPRLRSIRAENTHELVMKEWQLPPPIIGAAQPRDAADECATRASPKGMINSRTQAVVCPRTPDPDCLKGVDDTWILRPPSVLASPSGAATIVFTRLRTEPYPADPRSLGIAVEALVVDIAATGACKRSKPTLQKPAIKVSKDPEASKDQGPTEANEKDTKDKRRAEIAALRARPVLAARMSAGENLNLVFPDAVIPGRSFLLTR